MKPPTIRSARGSDALALLDERWDALLARQTLPNPTLSSPWLADALCLEPGEPLVVTVESGDRLIAGGAFGLRRIPGRRGARYASWPCDGRPLVSADLLVDPDAPDAARGVVEGIFESAAWISGRIHRDGPLAVALRERCPWARATPDPRLSYRLTLTPAVHARRCHEVTYESRRAARNGAEISLRVWEKTDEVAAALERLFALHRDRWRERDDVSRFSHSEALRDWHRRAIARMAERGGVRMAEVVEDGELVASELALLFGRGGLLHTCAMRTGGRLRSPGNTAKLAVIESLIAAGCEGIDMGAGGGAHKLRYAPDPVAYLHVGAGRNPPRARWLRWLTRHRKRAQPARSEP